MSEFREHYAPAALYQATGLEPVLEAFLANSSAPTREWASQVGRKGKDPESLYEGSGLGFARTFLWAICVYLTGANRSPTKPPVFPTASSTATPLYNPTVNPQQSTPPPPHPTAAYFLATAVHGLILGRPGWWKGPYFPGQLPLAGIYTPLLIYSTITSNSYPPLVLHPLTYY